MLPNEDFRESFRTTFQWLVAKIEKVLRKDSLESMLPKRRFGNVEKYSTTFHTTNYSTLFGLK